jgi:hypothetical protein
MPSKSRPFSRIVMVIGAAREMLLWRWYASVARRIGDYPLFDG